MSTALQPVDLTGAMVGTTGSIDLSQVIGPGGISYAQTGQGTLRLHNESNCGLLCSFDNSIQSFNLPAGGWSDSYPKSSDDALNFTVLYTLSGPGVTLLLSTYYYPGEPVPAITTLGNSPIGGGNVQTNFSQLTNTANNPGSSVINVQPNDASAPTITATNSGNFVVSGDNAGVLTTLLQLIAGASPEVILAASSVLSKVLGNMQVNGMLFVGDTPGNNTVFEARTNTASRVAMQAIAASGQTADIFEALGGSPSFAKLAWIDASGNINLANNLALQSQTSGGAAQPLILLNASNNTVIEAPASKVIAFLVGGAQQAQVTPWGLQSTGIFGLGSSGTTVPLTNGATIPTVNGLVTCTSSGAVTGIIMAQPASGDGIVFAVVNDGAGSITFAASGTSNVDGGTAISIGSNNSALFVHSLNDNLWHRIVAN